MIDPSECFIHVMDNESYSDLSYSLNDIIHLNVGGKRFDTTLRTLLSDKNHELYHHFSILLENGLTAQLLPTRDETGAFFLDQDPQTFKSILSNLRCLSKLSHERRATSQGGENSDDEGKSHKSPGFWKRLRSK